MKDSLNEICQQCRIVIDGNWFQDHDGSFCPKCWEKRYQREDTKKEKILDLLQSTVGFGKYFEYIDKKLDTILKEHGG